jgi:tetratricopeptide (TPR) repeat protein
MTYRRDEREAWAHYLLGRFLSDNYRYERAAELLRDALEYTPELVAARVQLGVAYCGLEQYEEMLEELREAVRPDVPAVREAIREEPKELEELRRILYPPREAVLQRRDSEPPIPAEVYESAALAEQALAEVAAGRDGRAVDLLERALRLDPTRTDVMAMLALSYLLLWESEGRPAAGNKGSVLWEEIPEVAKLLFGRDRWPTR